MPVTPVPRVIEVDVHLGFAAAKQDASLTFCFKL